MKILFSLLILTIVATGFYFLGRDSAAKTAKPCTKSFSAPSRLSRSTAPRKRAKPKAKPSALRRY